MMNKADALFIKITGGAIVLLLGIVGYYQKETNETIKENTKALQQIDVEVKVNKTEVDGYCKVFDLRLNDFDEKFSIFDLRINKVEKQLNINSSNGIND